jgi:hypothetical protein
MNEMHSNRHLVSRLAKQWLSRSPSESALSVCHLLTCAAAAAGLGLRDTALHRRPGLVNPFLRRSMAPAAAGSDTTHSESRGLAAA